MTYEEAFILTKKSMEEFRIIPEQENVAYVTAAYDALKKRVPMKPGERKGRMFCDSCGHWFDETYNVPFCPSCGQAQDWRKNERAKKERKRKMKIYKWNANKRDYEETERADDWKLPLFCDDMNEIINCVNCGREIPFGKGYTSRRWHTEHGFGYSECESCYFSYKES